MTPIREPLWGVDACRVDADLPRTPKPISRADVPESELKTVLAPNPTTPEEGL